MKSAPMTEIDSGTSCALSAFLFAVTITSSMMRGAALRGLLIMPVAVAISAEALI